MAKTQDNQAFISETSPIIMRQVDAPNDYEADEVIGTTGGCGCFRLFCFGNRNDNDGIKFLQHSGEYTQNNKESPSWLIKKLKDLKEFSEVVAGPKWKNFIRKFSKKGNKKNAVFQYDPQSYALNFNGDDEDDGFLARKFSTRFAPPSSGVSDQSRRPNNL